MNSKDVIDQAYNYLNNKMGSSKCKKGHSYRPDLKRTEVINNIKGKILRRKWTCIHCGRFMEQM